MFRIKKEKERIIQCRHDPEHQHGYSPNRLDLTTIPARHHTTPWPAQEEPAVVFWEGRKPGGQSRPNGLGGSLLCFPLLFAQHGWLWLGNER
jgi:hypothetical protein